MKQREAKWAVSMAFYNTIEEFPCHIYAVLPGLLFAGLLVFVDEMEQSPFIPFHTADNWK